jgi:hypothetical protein
MMQQILCIALIDYHSCEYKAIAKTQCWKYQNNLRPGFKSTLYCRVAMDVSALRFKWCVIQPILGQVRCNCFLRSPMLND